MNIAIRSTPEFNQQFIDIERWWKTNRPAAANQLNIEMQRISIQLQEFPQLGMPYKHQRYQNVRWLKIRKTPYKLYYQYKVDKMKFGLFLCGAPCANMVRLSNRFKIKI